MQIDPKVLSSLERIEWLKSCGMDSSLSAERSLRQLSSWAEADAAYDENWESIKNQQQNAITSALSKQYKDRFQQWNDLLDVAKLEISQRVGIHVDNVVEILKLNPFYSKAICRDILLYVMEVTYAKAGCIIPIFYRNLFAIYSAGHFPCGWSGGAFPTGYALYY